MHWDLVFRSTDEPEVVLCVYLHAWNGSCVHARVDLTTNLVHIPATQLGPICSSAATLDDLSSLERIKMKISLPFLFVNMHVMI